MHNKLFKFLGISFLLLVFIALILVPLHKKPLVKKIIKQPIRTAQVARIVIVIDDWGYSLNNLPIAKQIKQPLTCAILPNLKNTSLVMQNLNRLGFEIILHLPMEPKEKYNLEKDTISVGLSAAAVEKIFTKDLISVSLAKGVSNHMGSRVSEDMRSSALVIAEVKRRKLYFFDSFVTDQSVFPVLARQAKIRFAQRDVFLDNQNDSVYIKGQLLKLKKLAHKQGYAIGIGHDRKNTLNVLKEMLPQMEKDGYQFVFLSQVAR